MKFFLPISLLLMSMQVFSQDNDSTDYSKHVIYGGAGTAERDDPNKSDDTPWNVGYLYHLENGHAFLGADIAGEGTSVENTSHKDDYITQGLSYNFIFGGNLFVNQNWRTGVGVLVGAREAAKSCPDSYLGYECYADQDPAIEYKFNYGVLLHFTFSRAMVGARVSGESAQFMLGLAF